MNDSHRQPWTQPMLQADLFKKFNVTEEALRNTPQSVLNLLMYCLEQIAILTKRVEELEARLNQNSKNSSRPPSTDPPSGKKASKKHKKAGAWYGRSGFRQAILDPGSVEEIKPEVCSCCGSDDF